MIVLSRVEAGHYVSKDRQYTLKRHTDVYRCAKNHKYRGEYCMGGVVHLMYLWTAIHNTTGEVLGEYRTKHNGKQAIERHHHAMSNALQEARAALAKDQGRKFLPLPAGTNNFEIKSLKMEQDQKGRKYINMQLHCSMGSGFKRLYLEKMSEKHTTFLTYFLKDIEGLGFDTSGYDDEVLIIRDFIRYAPSLKGKVVEAFVKHSEYTDSNGETRTRDNVYFNRLVDNGVQQDELGFDDGNAVSVLEDEFNATPIDDDFTI